MRINIFLLNNFFHHLFNTLDLIQMFPRSFKAQIRSEFLCGECKDKIISSSLEIVFFFSLEFKMCLSRQRHPSSEIISKHNMSLIRIKAVIMF